MRFQTNCRIIFKLNIKRENLLFEEDENGLFVRGEWDFQDNSHSVISRPVLNSEDEIYYYWWMDKVELKYWMKLKMR